ncbi:nucleotidyltransferase [Candidatus Xianfuyuplasma coldseepsis]|uniref:tRNA(Met) cytidine acetate ligase n=1 Tax=Candidatus Xianfuyuplasma coldseepsis TaxID=2782163 RepID=A0A7L7KS79_9MOLU|nr:nucleotidyltransferase [Xianfuyuplasma coldseepsis]QMS85593.1 nucleotidyltransferase [Xianfuyuplasma coldseepsis]
MKIVGIVVEYNPLHNGHLHHINEVKRQSKCDVLIAVMSGYFTQRGEPAIVDKFTRTKWALSNGIDLVVELPFVWSVQNANRFAFSSIAILDKLGVTDVYFGSESNDIEQLKQYGDVLQSDSYNQKLHTYLQEGYSYPTASDMAMSAVHPNSDYDKPNNILGIQYIIAGNELHSSITFHTIQRIKTGYFDHITEHTDIQSATAIRQLLRDQQDISMYVPQDVARTFDNHSIVTYDDFVPTLKSIVHRESAESLQQYAHVVEGLENRMKTIHTFDSIDSFIQQLISKRYPISKLQRMIAHILCNVTDSEITSFRPQYIRVLGMNTNGQGHLNAIKKDIDVPIYTKIKEGLHPYIDIELRVAKVYSIASKTALYTQEFKPVII